MTYRVYIVEDNEFVRENLIEALDELPRVKVVGSTVTESEASYWLQKNCDDWDLAVVDLFLEQGNGLGVLESCKRRAPGQKVIMLSNNASANVHERCKELGADAVFDKAEDLDKFNAFIEACRQQELEKA
ncbi:MAG: response regulator [Pseudomonadota bacterium]